MSLLEQLFKPGWQSEDEAKSLKAVGKISDQPTLARIAKEAPHWETRKYAVEKLDEQHQALHQQLFADIIKSTPESLGRSWRAARNTLMPLIEKLTDQALLADVEKNADISSARVWKARRESPRRGQATKH